MPPDSDTRAAPRAPALARVLAVGAAAVIVAMAVALILEPSGRLPGAPVGASEFFSRARLDRIESFAETRRLIGIASLAVQFALLAFLALYRGAPMRRLLDRLDRRPYLGAIAIGAGISLLLWLCQLPIGWLAHRHALDYGLATQGFRAWLGDGAISAAISAALAGLGALVAIVLWRRLGRWFWLAGTAVVVAFAVLSTWLWPVVVAPVFNRFEPLPDGPVRAEVLRLADRAGVDVGQVYRVDASRRSSGLNAYVNGIGSTKRVVIYDNSLRELSRPQLRSLIAHELGHVKGNDLYRGLLFVLLAAPLGVLFVQLATAALARRRGDPPDGPGVLPALVLWLTLALFVLGIPGNVLSRSVEARADSFALELTREPRALIGLQKRLAVSNLSDPDPPGILEFMFGTHPGTMDRIGVAVEFERSQGRR